MDKESMRQSIQEWMCEERAKDKKVNLKQPTHLSKVWDSISQETVINSFLVCWISKALDGSEDSYTSDDD